MELHEWGFMLLMRCVDGKRGGAVNGEGMSSNVNGLLRWQN